MNLSQVVIIVLGDEEEVIHEAHRGPEAGMGQGSGKERDLELIDAREQPRPSSPEIAEQTFERLSVMISLLGLAVL